jgi:hypothetical protein
MNYINLDQNLIKQEHLEKIPNMWKEQTLQIHSTSVYLEPNFIMLKLPTVLTFLVLSTLIILKPVLIREILALWSNKRKLKTNLPEMLGNCVQPTEKFQLTGLVLSKKLLDKNVSYINPMFQSNKKLISNLIFYKLFQDLIAVLTSLMNNTEKIGDVIVQLVYTKVLLIYHYKVF